MKIIFQTHNVNFSKLNIINQIFLPFYQSRLPAFFPHVAGVVLTVHIARKYAEWTWALAGVGLVLEGLSCIMLPFCTNYFILMIPICIICFGIALIDTALLPLLGFIVDKKVNDLIRCKIISKNTEAIQIEQIYLYSKSCFH